MKAIKDDNFVTILGWMRKFNLTPNELMCYAVIYGFSQDEESYFKGTLKYLEEWINVSRPTLISILKRLVNNGLLIKKEVEENKVRLCYYMAVKKFNGGVVKNFNGGSKKNKPNNNIDNNSISDDIHKKSLSKSGFQKPTIDEIGNYVKEKKLHIDAEQFFYFYESKGWKIGKESMKSWKAACHTWERKRKSQEKENQEKKSDEAEGIQLPEGLTPEKWEAITKWLACNAPSVLRFITPEQYLTIAKAEGNDAQAICKFFKYYEKEHGNE